MRLQTSCAVLAAWMLAAAPLQAAPNTVVRITTPLHGLAVNEELVLRVIDLQGIANRPARVTATFVDEDGRFVQTVMGSPAAR